VPTPLGSERESSQVGLWNGEKDPVKACNATRAKTERSFPGWEFIIYSKPVKKRCGDKRM